MPPAAPPPAPRHARGARLYELFILVAGVALGLWLMLGELREAPNSPIFDALSSRLVLLAASLLGGLSLVGVPLLLRVRRLDRRPWGPGALLWFATGTAAWLLWPPVIVRRIRGGDFGDTTSGLCFAYGTPLMALYVVLALLAGGWLRKKRRRRYARRSWHERFGLLLGLAWAIVGLYLLVSFYKEDLSR